MIRLFLPPEKLFDEKIIIIGEQARYLSLVLRVKPGELFTAFDGSGFRYIYKILHVHKKEILAEKIKAEKYSTESPLLITLAQGIPKGDKMDFIVQKSTELGVNKIIPLITERSQVKQTGKSARWRKIVLSASQQCGREKIPEIMEAMEIEDLLKNLPLPLLIKEGNIPLTSSTLERGEGVCDRGEISSPLKKGSQEIPPLEKGDAGGFSGIIFSEEQKDRNLKKILTSFKDIKTITLLIGPEGGFSETETKIAVEKGFISASLGPRILRTETAPITALSILQYELGDMG